MSSLDSNQGLSVVVMGTGPFILPSFESLLASRHRIVAVITRPNRAARGRRAPVNPMREAAEKAGFPLLDPPDVNAVDVQDEIRACGADIMLVCDYGQILSADTLGTTPLGGINLHGSILPRHRGAAPVQWAILCGDKQTGVSVIHMTPRLDAGRVISTRSTPIGSKESSAELEARLSQLGAEAVLDSLDSLEAMKDAINTSDMIIGQVQDEKKATLAPRIKKQDGVINWEMTATEIDRRRRAFDPWPRMTAFVPHMNVCRRLVCLETEVVAGQLDNSSSQPGVVVEIRTDCLVVACGRGSRLAIRRVIPEGKRAMPAADFIRGSSLQVGSQLPVSVAHGDTPQSLG
jgi:methionyl-tRNA formyltransferase